MSKTPTTRQVKLFAERSLDILQDKLNSFLKDLPKGCSSDVSFNVTYNFLPLTNIGEFQELWYGCISYDQID